MTRYVIDTDVLANIQRVKKAGVIAALGRLPVVITDTVWDEFVEDPVRKAPTGETPQRLAERQGYSSEARALVVASAGSPTVIETGSEEANVLARFQSAGRVAPGGGFRHRALHRTRGPRSRAHRPKSDCARR